MLYIICYIQFYLINNCLLYICREFIHFLYTTYFIATSDIFRQTFHTFIHSVYTVQCTLYIVHCVHCTLYSVQCTQTQMPYH